MQSVTVVTQHHTMSNRGSLGELQWFFFLVLLKCLVLLNYQTYSHAIQTQGHFWNISILQFHL